MIEFTAQLVRYEPGLEMAPHADGCRRLSVLIGGAQAEQSRASIEPAQVGSVALKGADFEHQNRFGARGCTILSVLLDDRSLRALGQPAEELLDWRWLHAGGPAVQSLGLAAALRRGDGAGAARRLAALLAGFSSRVPDANAATRVARIDPRAERVAALVEESREHALSLGELAAGEDLHPASLDRVFRRSFGCAITTFRQRERVRAVAQDLLDSELALVHVALRHGFSDLSHMSRVFTREVGVPPGRFRALLRAQPRGLDSFKTEWQLTA